MGSTSDNLFQDKVNRLLALNQNSATKMAEWCVAVLDSIEKGVNIINQDAIVLYVNPAGERISGVPMDHFIGRPLSEVHPEAILPKVMQSGVPLTGHLTRLGHKDHVSDLAPIMVSGKVVGGIAIYEDMVQAKQLAISLKNYEQQKNHLKSMINDLYKASYHFTDIVGNSRAIQEVVRLSQKIASGGNDILIHGETGTGKEMFAQSIHNASHRATKPFIPINCSTLTHSLVESELFGYEEGSFTGAQKGGKIGIFEIADGGTIFLDEISDLPLELQSKFLRALQERKIRRVGNTAESHVDVRVIAATNRNLPLMVKEGKFREDLYYRLNVMSVTLPPLRDRGGDIREMADYFLEKVTAKIRRRKEFDPAVYDAFLHYEWPGNIRELRNVIEFAVNVSESAVIELRDFPGVLCSCYNLHETKGNTLSDIIHHVERTVIAEGLKRYGTTLAAKKRLASDLGISLASLYSKMDEIDKRKLQRR